MNSIAAISAAFLRGEVLTIKTAFRDFGITNLPRECGRAIERKFGVQLTRVKRVGKSRWGIECTWHEYRLPDTDYNKEGRAKMVEYLRKHRPDTLSARTTTEKKRLQQTELFLSQ